MTFDANNFNFVMPCIQEKLKYLNVFNYITSLIKINMK